MVERRLQVCGYSDRLTWRGLREDLIRLIQYIVMTTGSDISIVIQGATNDDLRSVEEANGVGMGKVGRKLMRVHLNTSATIEVDDF